MESNPVDMPLHTFYFFIIYFIYSWFLFVLDRCFTFADMGWVTRNLAATLFASPPTSNYDEVNIALIYETRESMFPQDIHHRAEI